jgi:hypothetical protein
MFLRGVGLAGNLQDASALDDFLRGKFDRVKVAEHSVILFQVTGCYEWLHGQFFRRLAKFAAGGVCILRCFPDMVLIRNEISQINATEPRRRRQQRDKSHSYEYQDSTIEPALLGAVGWSVRSARFAASRRTSVTVSWWFVCLGSVYSIQDVGYSSKNCNRYLSAIHFGMRHISDTLCRVAECDSNLSTGLDHASCWTAGVNCGFHSGR